VCSPDEETPKHLKPRLLVCLKEVFGEKEGGGGGGGGLSHRSNMRKRLERVSRCLLNWLKDITHTK